MKKLYLRKTLSVLLLLVIGFNYVPPRVLAQELEKLSDYEPSQSVISTPLATGSAMLGENTFLGNAIENAIKSLNYEASPFISARFAGLINIHKLHKKDYGRKEKVTVVIDNPPDPEKITTKLLDSSGEEVKIRVEKIKQNNSLVLSILPPVNFYPGKYTLSVTDEATGQSVEQDFVWGVLALNTNKSVYAPNEEAQISIAVLDDKGKMVCDADVELKITNSSLNIDDTLTTENGDISVNSQCDFKEFSLTPDYEASYTVGDEGVYELELRATTENGEYSVTDKFLADSNSLFDIERISATRIYPAYTYPVEIKIEAKEDFTGTIVEIVPEGFDIKQKVEGNVIPFDSISVGSFLTTPTSDVLGTSTSLVMPFEGNHKVTSLFGDEVDDPILSQKYKKYGVIGHDGVDFDMPIGTSVVSTDDGEVVLVDRDGDYGQTVTVEHSWGKSYYGHLSEILVQKGDKVEKGQEIAKSGNSGLSTDGHLHFGIKLNENNSKNGYFGKVDPSPLLGVTNVKDVLGIGTRGEDTVKMISWNISIRKGQTVTIGYSYQAPYISPQFYTLGPLRLYKNNAFVYGEERSWQIAVDDTTSYTISDGSLTAAVSSNSCNSFSNGTTTDGAQGTVLSSSCTGRNDTMVLSWTKTLSWESMGLAAGSTITQVDGSYLYRVFAETHAATQAIGSMQLRNSTDTADCAASDLEASFDPGAPAAGYTTRNALGNINVNSECQASSTTVTIRLNMTVATGANNSANSELRADDIALGITFTPPQPDLEQIHYRWRNDDDNEANATFRRDEDTSMSRNKNIVMRLRFEVSNEGDATATGTTYRLEYGTLSTACVDIASWTAVPVTATTEHFDIEGDSNGIVDGSATTDVTINGGLTNENTSFTAGEFKDAGNTTSGITLTTSQYTEIEYALQANTNASNGTTYCFRLTNAGSTTNFTYTKYAEWTVGEPTMDQNHYRWRNDDGAEATLVGSTITLHPTSQGNYTAWTATGCTEDTGEWDCVNDNNTSSGTPGADDAGTTALATTTAGARSSFNLGDNLIPGGAIVSQLQIFMVGAEVSAAGPDATVTAFYRLSGNDNDCAAGASAFSTATYSTASCTFSGLSLTASQLNSVELGILFGANDPTITKVYVTVTYSSTGASWKEDEDVEHVGQATEENLRLRVEVANTGGITATRKPRLEFAQRTGLTCGDEIFDPVPTVAGSDFQMADSSYVFNEEATTTQLTSTGTFIAGQMLDTANVPTNGVDISGSFYTEFEYNFIANSSAADKTFCFKLTDSGTDLNAYTLYPVLSVVINGPLLEQLLRHGTWFLNGEKQPFTF
jgi:murein DD-endopeptidase MepM/ murein hydrolase activator NlpD